jgi:AraC-like DNA-binding protein
VTLPNSARLHLPRPALGACIYMAVERDTRGRPLTDAQRFNHYPATPLPMVSWIFEGELHMVVEPPSASAPPALTPALPRLVFSGPNRKPSASWSPGPVHALSVAFHSDALSRLLGISLAPYLDKIVPLQELIGGTLLDKFHQIGQSDGRHVFHQLEAALQPLWQGARGSQALPTLRGWVQSLAVRAAFTRPGAGLRQAQRRFKDWTGQSHRDLQLYVRTERALVHATAQAQAEGTAPDLAWVAAEAGFADQSHLGREVRRVTGLPPGQLGELMRTHESFWFYRLLSGHLHKAAGEVAG